MDLGNSSLEGIATKLISTWLEPKFEKIINKLELKGKVLTPKIYKRRFKEYIERRTMKLYHMDTLVFQNMPKPLEDLYVPLTISLPLIMTDVSTEDLIERNKYKIKAYNEALHNTYDKILIADNAGMGKSTILKKICLAILKDNKGIPVLIELRKLNSNHKILSEITGQLTSFDLDIETDFILELIRKGDFIFLLDGFDEISFQDKNDVIQDLHQFIEIAHKNKFLIASRPEDSLASFSNFTKFTIDSLEPKEAYSLLKKYDHFNYKPVAEKLISELKKDKNKSAREFLRNPFLVSLLFKAFDYKRTIPFHKPQFFRQVYDALFENHDLSKQGYFIRPKESNLHIDDFEKVLRYLGYLTVKRGKVEFEKNELLELISKSRQYCSTIDFKSSDFLKDIIKNVPLFLRDGINYRWAHKSMMDYFTAKFILVDAKENQKGILLSMFYSEESGRYINILDIFFDLDYMTFRNTIIYEILLNHKDFVDLRIKKRDSNDDKEILRKQYSTIYFSKLTRKHSSFVSWFIYEKILKDNSREELKNTFKSMDNFHFDYEKCEKMLEEIEKDKKLFDSENLFKLD